MGQGQVSLCQPQVGSTNDNLRLPSPCLATRTSSSSSSRTGAAACGSSRARARRTVLSQALVSGGAPEPFASFNRPLASARLLGLRQDNSAPEPRSKKSRSLINLRSLPPSGCVTRAAVGGPTAGALAAAAAAGESASAAVEATSEVSGSEVAASDLRGNGAPKAAAAGDKAESNGAVLVSSGNGAVSAEGSTKARGQGATAAAAPEGPSSELRAAEGPSADLGMSTASPALPGMTTSETNGAAAAAAGLLAQSAVANGAAAGAAAAAAAGAAAGTRAPSAVGRRALKPWDSTKDFIVGKEPDVPPSVFEYFEACNTLNFDDPGPPRFFCPLNGKPQADPDDVLPRLFFIPGIEGTGFGLALHHKALSRLFEVSCLHVPVKDRTSFFGLVEIVEGAVREEHRHAPHRALFLLGESFGTMVSLAVAQRNPDLPLTLILVNPATSFSKSQFQPLLPIIPLIPDALFGALPFFLSFSLGNPVKMAEAGIKINANPLEKALGIRENLLNMIGIIPEVGKLMPRDTVVWKVKLLEEGARHVEHLLPNISFPTLILASKEDQLVPSAEEAKRLKSMMKGTKAIVAEFDDSGHTLLLEGGLDMAAVIKGSSLYRRSSSPRENPWLDSFPSPTVEDVARVRMGSDGLIRLLCSPVFLSTRDNGRIVQGLDGVPTDQRPIIFVGNHQTYAPDLSILVGEMLEQTGMLMRGLAHPMAMGMFQGATGSNPMSNTFRTFGAVPVSPALTYKLLAKGEAVLLFPGGAREALKNRGEEYKLLWPDKAEIIRMAIKFQATIVPFAAVGVDDGYTYVADGPELLKLPYIGERMEELRKAVPRVRDESAGDAMEQFVPPVVLPRQINRLYFLFRKPIRTKGLGRYLNDKDFTLSMYRHAKQEVQDGLDYVLRKREEDPYKDLALRLAYEASWGGERQAPTFVP